MTEYASGNAEERPFGSEYIWQVFMHLHAARTHQYVYGFDKAIINPIGFCEIDSYSRLTDNPLEPWEVALIRRLDSLVRAGEFRPVELEPLGGVKAMMQNMAARGKR